MKVVAPETVGFAPGRLGRVGQAIQRYIDESKIAGAVSLVARRGQVAYLKAFGMMDVEAQKPMALDTIFRIYSMTKPIASVAVMMLYEEGHFHLTDPVHRFIPEFEDLKVFLRKTESGLELADLERPITVHDLLTHMSGLTYPWETDPYIDQQYQKHVWGPWERNRDITLEELVWRVTRCPLANQPGSQFRYSMATDVLGYLVQVVSGQPFDAFLEERILGPLGMVDTSFHVPPDKVERFATCYQPSKDGGIEVQDAPETSRFAAPTRCPAGGMGLLSTTADYYRFAQMLYNKGELEGERLLGRKTVELMTANHLPQGIYRDGDPSRGFGLGFGVVIDAARAKGLESAGTYGWGGAASTRFRIDPQEELVHVLMLQLLGNTDRPVQDDFAVAIYQAIVD